MEIIPVVRNIQVLNFAESPLPKNEVLPLFDIKPCVINSQDSNMLVCVRKSIVDREIKQEEQEQNKKQLFCITDVIFFNRASIQHIRLAVESSGKFELDLSNLGVRDVSCLRSLNMNHLCKLDLSNNRLLKKDFDFDIPPSLEDLDLSHNHFIGLPSSIKNSRLIKINLSHNLFHKIPELPNVLKILHLSSNSVSEIRDDLPDSLIVLNLFHNLIQTIPDTLLYKLKNLDVLNLADNVLLTNFPLIPAQHKLSFLDVSSCNIDKNSLVSLPSGLRLYI